MATEAHSPNAKRRELAALHTLRATVESFPCLCVERIFLISFA